jgi:cyclopropane fatty-acyl-phospholipid synthase-like methyltransferase
VQCQLTDTLADMAQITSDHRVVDVGCGKGRSSIRLAKTRGCDVVGVTLSPVQKHWASVSAKLTGAGGKTRFVAGDAEQVEFDDESFDVMWCIECSEHLFDKPAFFERAASMHAIRLPVIGYARRLREMDHRRATKPSSQEDRLATNQWAAGAAPATK